MRRRRRKNPWYNFDQRWLLVSIGIVVLLYATINCTSPHEQSSYTGIEPPQIEGNLESADQPTADIPLSGVSLFEDDVLWADLSKDINLTSTSYANPTNISLNVQDANLLDVLSLLAYKLDANIIFIATPTTVTFRSDNLSPLNTLQLLLQKEGLDYLAVGKNYVIGERGRLYSDFYNRTVLTKVNLTYVSATAMNGYLSQMNVPVETLTVDPNQQEIWLQGTPMAIGRAREVINAIDHRYNAVFAEGGSRKIRMVVAYVKGPRAEEELEALIDILSILLDGYRDDRTDMGWVTWNHPDPLPRIYMEWETPVIKPYDILMKITRDFNNDYTNQLRYLIAEGTPATIDLVNQMIFTIRQTPALRSPLELDAGGQTGTSGLMQWGGTGGSSNQSSPATSVSTHHVTVSAVPPQAATLRGGGTYVQGSSVTVIAEPTDDYQFVRWIEEGAELSTDPTYTFLIYSNRILEAVFSKK